MEDKKSSFYEILAANSKPTTENEDVKVKPIHTFLSWTTILLCNSVMLWLAWNMAGVQLLNLRHATFFECVLLYSGVKTLTRGFFSIQ